MAMVWLRVLPTAVGRDIELTPEVAHRSVDGHTLILTPGTTREVTEDEWSFIQGKHTDLLPGIERLDNGTQPSDADNGEAANQSG